MLSHLPDGFGSLAPGLGGKGGRFGVGMKGEYLGRRGGGGKKLGFVTITGVLWLEGGEQFGVTRSSLLGDSWK